MSYKNRPGYMGNQQFLKYFQKKLTAAKPRSNNTVGSDYNRSQQAINAVLGRNNRGQGGGYAAQNANNPASAGAAALDTATRNRNAEQMHRKGTKPAENDMAKANSIGARLFGDGKKGGNNG